MTAQLDLAPVTAEVAATGAGARTGRRRPGRAGLPIRGVSGVSLGVVVLWLSVLVLLPLAAVVGKAFGAGWSQFITDITNRETAAALRLTVTLSVSVAVVNGIMGTLVAWVLVRERFPGARVLERVIDLP